jgi:hypothetical protein
MFKRLSIILFLGGCVGIAPPAPEWHVYTDVQKRNHIYNINLEELSQTRENVTEYYYCLQHERLEEIKVFWPIKQDSSLITPPLQDL